jgi:hypothetical protein
VSTAWHDKVDEAMMRVESELAQELNIEIGIGEQQEMGYLGNVARGMMALAAQQEAISKAWDEVIRAIAERLARRQATSLNPAPSRSAASFSLDPDHDQGLKAKKLVKQARREVEQVQSKILDLEEQVMLLKRDMKQKEKNSSMAWEEVIRAVAEHLEATSLGSAPSASATSSSATLGECAAPETHPRQFGEGRDSWPTGDAEGADEADIYEAAIDPAPSPPSSASPSATLEASEEYDVYAAAADGPPHPVPVCHMRHPHLYAHLRELGLSASRSGLHPDVEELRLFLRFLENMHRAAARTLERQQNPAGPAIDAAPSSPTSASSSATLEAAPGGFAMDNWF